MTDREEWVRVESQDELREWMPCEVRPCLRCGRKERFFLGREVPAGQTTEDPRQPGVFLPTPPGTRAFETVGDCTKQHPATQYHMAIKEGRLYRLADLDEDDEETVDLGELELDELLVD